MLSLSKTQLNSRCECQRNRGGGSQSESCVRPVFLQLSRNMHVIFCTYDSSVNEQFLLHNISFCIGAPSTIFSNLYVCIALWVLFEFCDYPLSSCLTPAFPVHAQFSCFLFPLHPNPSLLLFLVFFQRSGEERLRGVGMRRREGQESMKGRVGRGVWMASVWERKENDCVCVCVGGRSASWQIQCQCHWSRLKRRRAYLFSPFETHACSVWKSSRLFLSCNISTASSALTVEIPLWPHFHFDEGLFYFPPHQNQGHGLLASRLFVCLFLYFWVEY